MLSDPSAGVGILAALFAGMISFLSPGVLPLVPGYLSAVSGVSPDERAEASRARILIRADVLLRLHPARGPSAAAELPKGPELPDVSVKDLAGGSLSVADIKGDKPTLVWFYAPHCPYCNEEATKVEAFAKANADKLSVVGLGTQDSEQEAKDFVAEHGLKTPRMLYDESFASWQQLGIRGQPGAMMFDTEGVSRFTWVGAFDEQQALEVAKQLS